MMHEKGIAFTREIAVQHPYVYCDVNKMRDVMINILSNAYKYTQPGGSVNIRMEELPCGQESMYMT